MRIQLDVLRPTDPLPTSPELELRFEDGNRFEASIVDELRGLAGDDWVFVDERSVRAVEQTVEAMTASASVIVGSHLPRDETGKRSGKPDLLVRSGRGYVPVDIKHHRTLEEDADGRVQTSPLAAPSPDVASPRPGAGLYRRKGDALQLAHYQRMLESSGHASDAAIGGIIGTEREVTWYQLDVPMWQTPAKSDGKKVKRRTTLENYDFEFGFRLDVAAVAHEHLGDAARELLVLPVHCGECAECPWRDYCHASLTVGSGDPSLLPRVGYRPWRALREAGVTDRAGVAALDLTTARLGARGVDLAKVLESCAASDPAEPLVELLKRARKQVGLLEGAGIRTAGEALARLDASTARLAGASFLPAAILNARAAIGHADVYRLPGTGDPPVPRADLELDVDMESVADGVYLWGVHVHDRAGTCLAEEGYLPFVTWAELDAAEEARVFADFWSWLGELLRRAKVQGHTTRLFAWHAAAENTQMRRITAGGALELEVEELIRSDVWVDLEDVFKRRWTTGGSTGLKTIAPLAGHRWSVEDPGGGRSMVLHQEATDANTGAREREEARQWLLDYNRGDVEATLAIRRWLDEEGGGWSMLEDS